MFDEIITNPAEWEPSGLLAIRRRIDPHGLQHTCKVGCSPNMCKGEPFNCDPLGWKYMNSHLHQVKN
jgi:hypothetical protein